MTFDPNTVRGDFPALSGEVSGKPLIYLDNAATAQMPASVMDAVRFLELRRANVHRGIHTLSEECTLAYEAARSTCAEFLGAKPEQLVFTSGATDGINRIARIFPALYPGGVVTTVLEHHSNFVPWQQMCKMAHRPFRVAPILPDGTLDLEQLDRMLDGDISLLAVSHCSNVLGLVNPVEELCRLAHSRGIAVLVDGAQAVCHRDVNVEALGCDYYVCSGHKLGGPFGIGLLYCRRPIPPTVFGGGMVDQVSVEETSFGPFPLSMEAGTPNVSGAVGLAAAIDYRRQLPAGWQEHERALLARAEALLRRLPGAEILGTGTREGCLSFHLEGVSPFDGAVLLDKLGIALRSGHHCAQPLLRAMGREYVLRVSPAFYNTMEEIQALDRGLRRILPLLRRG